MAVRSEANNNYQLLSPARTTKEPQSAERERRYARIPVQPLALGRGKGRALPRHLGGGGEGPSGGGGSGRAEAEREGGHILSVRG